jgi:arylsulfatase A-like enzyme
VCDETVCHVDVLATLCAALDMELPAEAGPDSHNVLPAWLGEPSSQPLREATVCVSQSAAAFSIRRGPWKLLLNLNEDANPTYRLAAPELYHLVEDPAETQNRAAEHPEIVQELTALLQRYRDQGFSRPGFQAR